MSEAESAAVFESIRSRSRRDADELVAEADAAAERQRTLADRVQAALATGGPAAPDGLLDPDDDAADRGAAEWSVQEFDDDDDDDVQGWLR
jgi:hypothetical protein